MAGKLSDFWKVGGVPPVLGDIPTGGLAIDTTNKIAYSSTDTEVFQLSASEISDITGLQDALDGKEPNLGLPASDGLVLTSDTTGARSWTTTPPPPSDDTKVDKSGDTMTGNLEAPSITIGSNNVSPYSMRNKIINGGFELWQRGQTHTSITSNAYTADRWYLVTSGDPITITKNVGANNAAWQGLTPMTITNVDSVLNDSVNIQTRLENVNFYQNKKMTFALTHDASSGQEIKVMFRQHDGVSNIWDSGDLLLATGDGTVRRDSITIDLPPLASVVSDRTSSRLHIIIRPFTNMSDNINIGLAQFEDGDVATPFEFIPIGDTVSLCKRYYIMRSSLFYLYPDSNDMTRRNMFHSFPVQMREAPTVTPKGDTGGNVVVGLKTDEGFYCSATGVSASNAVSLDGYYADSEIY